MRFACLATLAACSLIVPPASAEVLRTNGVEIEYSVAGTGEPLVLLHGFGECINQSWGELIPELSSSYRVIAVNQRGHGGSTNPSGSFTHAQSAEDIKALMDSLGIETASAMGFSSGGMTLLHLATKYPERVSRMVLVGATTHFGEQARQIMRLVAAEGLPSPVRENFLKCAKRGSPQADELARQFGAFKDSYRDMNFTAGDLSKIKARSLIVHGDRDEFFPVAIPVAMYSAIPDSELWIVPGGDHSPTAGASQAAFLETVKSFLSKGVASPK